VHCGCPSVCYHHQFIRSKNDRVTCATKQIEWDSKDTDATNSCPRKVHSVTHFKNKEKFIGTMERLKAFSVEKFTLDGSYIR